MMDCTCFFKWYMKKSPEPMQKKIDTWWGRWYNTTVVNMRGCWNRQTGTFEVRVSIDVGVQVPSLAPKHSNPNLLPIGETFGFVVFLKDVK